MTGKKAKIISLEILDHNIRTMDKRWELKFKEMEESNLKTGVLLERLENKFDLLLEGFGALNRRIDELEKRMEEGFAENHYKFDVVFERLGALSAAR